MSQYSRELTPNQTEILTILRTRGADWSASAAEENWRKGMSAFFDDRNAATRGLIRKIKAANKEARS